MKKEDHCWLENMLHYTHSTLGTDRISQLLDFAALFKVQNHIMIKTYIEEIGHRILLDERIFNAYKERIDHFIRLNESQMSSMPLLRRLQHVDNLNSVEYFMLSHLPMVRHAQKVNAIVIFSLIVFAITNILFI